jgi:hypothetical protein
LPIPLEEGMGWAGRAEWIGVKERVTSLFWKNYKPRVLKLEE